MSYRILYIVPYVPNLIRVRPYNFIRSLSAHGNRVTVLTVCTDESDWEDIERLKEEVFQVEAVNVSRLQSVLNCIKTFPTTIPLQASFSWSEELKSHINRLYSEVDIVHVEHLRGARFGLYAASIRENSNPPIVWDSVDCISYLFEQAAQRSESVLGKLMSRLELPKTRRYEAWLLSMFDRVLVTSLVDKEKLEALQMKEGGGEINPITGNDLEVPGIRAGTSRIDILRNGVDLDYFIPTDEPRDPKMLVFSGKMSYHANITACHFLVDEVMPIIWESFPEARLMIVGKDPPKRIRNFAHRYPGRVEVTGTVPDIRPYLRRASIALLPIVYGAGCQNKILEALACETPVVTVEPAVTCLNAKHNSDILIAEDSEEIAKFAIRLLGDSQERRKIGKAGRKYVEKNHRWSDITLALEEIYCEVLNDDAR